MTNARKPQTESPARRRKRRARPVPSWLKEQQDLDEMAKRRCLLVLEVLSGAKPVTEAIEEAKISRPLYYQLETKALRGMLNALAPGADPTGQPVGMLEKVRHLEQKVLRLEQEKRRAERLLFVTRQVVRPGPMGSATGRPPRSSTKAGKSSSSGSTTKTAAAPSTPASTPTTAGGTVRSAGSGN